MTLRYGLIGDPVDHSLSPALQQAAFRARGIEATYDAIRVAPSALADEMGRLRESYAGLNVTTPLKESVIPFLDGVTAECSAARAVNAIKIAGGRLTGHNTDGSGFAAAIAEIWHISPRGKYVCILGSGPAARAIAFALGKLGAAGFSCWSRNASTATEIGPAPNRTPDLLVSALPPTAQLPAGVLQAVAGANYVFDVNYATAQSPLPPGLGNHRSDGLPLLLHQAALSFEWWTGVAAPLEAMRAEIVP